MGLKRDSPKEAAQKEEIMGNTVSLHYIETRVDDPFTCDTFAVEDSGFGVGEFTYVHEAEEYLLPEGYTVGETKYGLKGVFDAQDMYCELYAVGKTPALSSAAGIVYLKKAPPASE